MRGWFMGVTKANAVFTGLFFAVVHVPLFTVVAPQANGAMLEPVAMLGFVFLEGFVCALLNNKCGLLAAVIAHGLTIFVLSIV